MSNVPTSCNAVKEGEIARTVLMPGGPLHIKFIAEIYLEDVTCFNTIRNILDSTDTYKGRPVSVMGDGIGTSSVEVYIYELFNFYGVGSIIRIDSADGLADAVQLRDVIAGMGACTSSSSAEQYRLSSAYVPIADYGLLNRAVKATEELGILMKAGNVLSNDTFYNDNEDTLPAWKKIEVLAIEVGATTLYMNAARAGKNAFCLLTTSDHLLTEEPLPVEERQTGFTQMMGIALALA